MDERKYVTCISDSDGRTGQSSDRLHAEDPIFRNSVFFSDIQAVSEA
jgi:hypothetical protein